MVDLCVVLCCVVLWREIECDAKRLFIGRLAWLERAVRLLSHTYEDGSRRLDNGLEKMERTIGRKRLRQGW